MPVLIRAFSREDLETEGDRVGIMYNTQDAEDWRIPSEPATKQQEESKLALDAVDTYLRKYRNIEEIINALMMFGLSSPEVALEHNYRLRLGEEPFTSSFKFCLHLPSLKIQKMTKYLKQLCFLFLPSKKQLRS